MDHCRNLTLHDFAAATLKERVGSNPHSIFAEAKVVTGSFFMGEGSGHVESGPCSDNFHDAG